MIVIDTSALIAILLHEPEREQFFDLIAATSSRLISAVTVIEAGMVAYGRAKGPGLAELTDLLDVIDAGIVAFDEEQARLAIDAFIRYGKGNNPRARLNMGDCASYALARSRSLPLLFKGQDFAATDVVSAM
jgi:ribonuclease VapC